MKKELISTALNDEIRIKRLRYRSWHRGWKETDLILGRFADENLHKLPAEQLDIYEKLLDENDADIWDWLVEKQPVKNEEYKAILQALKPYGQYSGA